MSRIIFFSYYGIRESLHFAISELKPYFEVIDFHLMEHKNDSPKLIVDLIEKENPIHVLFFWCITISAESLKWLRHLFPDILFVFFNWDDPFCWSIPENEMKEKANVFDVVFTCSEECIPWYLDAGTKDCIWIPPGFNEELHQPRPNEKYKCDVSLCATQLYSDRVDCVDRKKIIDQIIQHKDISFKLYGPSIFGEMYPNHYSGWVNYSQTSYVYSNSFINICTHVSIQHKYVNERVMLVAGCGGLLLVDNCDQVFNENEYIKMNTQDIVNQIRQILSNKEKYQIIAKNAREHALNHYTWKHWAQQITQKIVSKIIDNDNYFSINHIISNNLTPYDHWLQNQHCIIRRLSIPPDFDWKEFCRINHLTTLKTEEETYYYYITQGKRLGMIFTSKKLVLPVQKKKNHYLSKYDKCRLTLAVFDALKNKQKIRDCLLLMNELTDLNYNFNVAKELERLLFIQ